MNSVRSYFRLLRLAGFATCLSAFAASAVAADTAVLLEFGTNEGDEDVQRYGAALRWDLGMKWLETGDWHLGSHLEASVTYWDGNAGTTGDDDFVDFGLTPVLRFQRTATAGLAPFAELGLGIHVHTKDGIGDRDFGIPFTFGTHFGAGARFGEQGRYELVYRFQHLSNAGLSDDNPGINFHAVQFGIHF
ncbi:MAG: acyloxyacyl hydrolase [Gammaproteobacteria bacterium]|nr:acyloxyacyl hydrolase [Gammaproteobacteria bacterium]